MAYFDAALCLAVVRTVPDYQETNPQRFDAAETRRQSAEFSNRVVVIDVSAWFVTAEAGYYAELTIRIYWKSQALGNGLGIVSGSG
jgi:hypothetical protein